jgi:hypothetical protein
LRRIVLLSCMAVSVLLSLCFVVSVDAESLVWNQTYGGADDDEACSLVATSDGGYALAGGTLLVKTDEFGNMEWNRTYGAGSGWDGAYSLVEASDGGYALAGYVNSVDWERSSWIHRDFWLVKTDANGNTVWSRTYGGTGYDWAYSLVATSDGGYAIAGYTVSSGAGNADFWLVKTDEFGNMEWNRTYGGAEMDIAYSLIATSDGGYALAGETWSFGDGTPAFWLVKTDASGNMEWNRTYGTVWGWDGASSLVEASDGGYAIAGDSLRVFAGVHDFWLVKTDEFGNVQWNRTYGGPEQDWATSLVETPDGGYAIAGNNRPTELGRSLGEYDTLLVKTDEFGNMEWSETYEGTGRNIFVRSLVVASDGRYVLAGSIDSFGAGDRDFWLVKTDGCMCPYECETYEYDYLFGYFTYTIVVHSNSTIEDFNFDLIQNQISFNVTGPNQTTGFCRIAIPKVLLDGDFPVYLNGEPMTEGEDYTKTINGTHTIIQITYSHSTHLITITGTHTIPEISTWTAPTIILATTLVIVIYKKKRST